MDKLVAMRTFVEIAEQGSLAKAARSLGKSSPTMVRVLAELEHDLGVVLLRRTTRRMSLTEEGTLYLERCRSILADVDEADAMVGSGQAEPRGLLRVTAPVLFGQMHVGPAVLEFVRRHPKLHVELLLVDRVVNLVEEGVDVAVRIGSLPDSGLLARRVGTMRRVVCASPECLDAHGRPEHPRELAELPCIRFMGISAAPVWRFVEGGREFAVAIDGPLRVNQAATAVDACVAGLGFGRFLSYQALPAVRAGQLEVVLQAFERPSTPVSLVCPDARRMSARVRLFLDWMKQRLQSIASS